MKKYLVIGNPIEHSLSPRLHNYWMRKNNIDAIYEKKKIKEGDLKELILDIKKEKIHGINVTVPFKKTVINYLDDLTEVSKKTQSVNTIYKKEDKILGHNTDVGGFEKSFTEIDYEVKNKKIFILGAGGVVSSIIAGLKNLGGSEIILSNRTKENAKKLKELYSDLKILDWGQNTDFDIIINATSLGLKKEDNINLNLQNIGKNKLFYDVIYNPSITNFLQEGKKLGNKTINGRLMFVYQAQLAFKVWHNILPEINNEIIDLLKT
jgi:shikimate dehydrogenase